MKVSLKLLLSLGILVLLVIFTSGCVNIFGFTSSKEKTPVEKAEAEIRDGNYEKARAELDDIIDTTDDSMVIYTYAKATLLEADVNVAYLVDLVQGNMKVSDGFNNPLLQKIDTLDVKKQNAWYGANIKVSKLLTRIMNKETVGNLKDDDIALDYTVSTVLSTVLGLRDTNQDGVINYAEDIKLDLIGFDKSQGFVLGEIAKDENDQPIMDTSGKPINKGLIAFLGGWTPKAAKGGNSAETYMAPSPDDINTLVSFVLSKLDEGEEGITFLITMYANPDDRKSSISYEDVKDYIVEIGKYVNYFWYNDGIDNDGNNGADEETIDGIDNDGDGLIDEDTGYHPIDSTNIVNNQYYDLFYTWYNR
ncbi:hypothetical protein LLG96_12320 [bacterium]|nr:hypothetical protein [bacterium]